MILFIMNNIPTITIILLLLIVIVKILIYLLKKNKKKNNCFNCNGDYCNNCSLNTYNKKADRFF